MNVELIVMCIMCMICSQILYTGCLKHTDDKVHGFEEEIYNVTCVSL